MNSIFINDCAADGCYKKNLGKGKQMCKEHQKMYDEGKPFKAFYGKTVLKKELTMGNITSDKKIRIYDDTGSGDSFELSKLLYEDENVILCNVSNEWYEKELTVLIHKDCSVVSSKELRFYYAENFLD